MIFYHEILIEKEMILLLGADLPELKPFYLKIDWDDLKEFKTQINNTKKFEYKKLGLDKSTINEIDLLFSSFFDQFNKSDSKNTIEEAKSGKIEKNSTSKEQKCNSAKIKKNIYENKILNSPIKDEKPKSVNISEVDLSMTEKDFPKNFINHDDFRIDEKIENIEYNYYIPDNNTIETLLEGEVINYINIYMISLIY